MQFGWCSFPWGYVLYKNTQSKGKLNTSVEKGGWHWLLGCQGCEMGRTTKGALGFRRPQTEIGDMMCIGKPAWDLLESCPNEIEDTRKFGHAEGRVIQEFGRPILGAVVRAVWEEASEKEILHCLVYLLLETITADILFSHYYICSCHWKKL